MLHANVEDTVNLTAYRITVSAIGGEGARPETLSTIHFRLSVNGGPELEGKRYLLADEQSWFRPTPHESILLSLRHVPRGHTVLHPAFPGVVDVEALDEALADYRRQILTKRRDVRLGGELDEELDSGYSFRVSHESKWQRIEDSA